MAVSERDIAMIEATFAAGGRSALGEAYRLYGSLVHTYCVRSVGATSAADVTQEVFVSAWRAQHRYDAARGTLAGWLIAIAKYRCVDHWRKRREQPVADHPQADGPAGPDEFEQLADRLVLDDALSLLPERQRTVVELAHLDGLTHEQIADRTGLPIGTVKSDLRRSIPRLARALRSAHEVVNHG